jgi:hypothetical protein
MGIMASRQSHKRVQASRIRCSATAWARCSCAQSRWCRVPWSLSNRRPLPHAGPSSSTRAVRMCACAPCQSLGHPHCGSSPRKRGGDAWHKNGSPDCLRVAHFHAKPGDDVCCDEWRARLLGLSPAPLGELVLCLLCPQSRAKSMPEASGVWESLSWEVTREGARGSLPQRDKMSATECPHT